VSVAASPDLTSVQNGHLDGASPICQFVTLASDKPVLTIFKKSAVTPWSERWLPICQFASFVSAKTALATGGRLVTAFERT
jgi:hypothetical protein